MSLATFDRVFVSPPSVGGHEILEEIRRPWPKLLLLLAKLFNEIGKAAAAARSCCCFFFCRRCFLCNENKSSESNVDDEDDDDWIGLDFPSNLQASGSC